MRLLPPTHPAESAALVLGRVIQNRKLCVYGVVSLGLREISQKAEFRCAGSDAGSLFWYKMPFRSFSG